MAKGKAKPRIAKSVIMPLCTKLPHIELLMMMMRRNKVGPKPFSNKRNNGIMLLSDGLMGIDRRDDEYLQARRAVLHSYNLSDGHMSLRQKMKSSLRGLWSDVSAAVRARVGIRVFRFTVGCPWSAGVLVFRCFLPDVKCIH